METDYLCKCNNCETVMIDENPQTNAEKHPLTGKEVEMEYFYEKGDRCWGCPVCKTDAYLKDL